MSNTNDTNDPNVSKTNLRIPLDAVRLRQARQAKLLTLEEVSAAVFINKMTLLRYETGDIRAIAPERLERLAKEADLDPEFAKKFLAFIISEVIRHHETFQQ